MEGRAKNGQRFTFTLLNRAGTTDRIAAAQVIQAQLKSVGVEVVFETLESASWTQKWRGLNWEAIVSAWFLPADPSFTGLFQCGGRVEPEVGEPRRSHKRELQGSSKEALQREVLR